MEKSGSITLPWVLSSHKCVNLRVPGHIVRRYASYSRQPRMAQVVSATLTGTVTDSSGAVVPGPHGDGDRDEHRRQPFHANQRRGRIPLLFLNPGTYKVDVDKEGFKKFTEANLQRGMYHPVGRVNATLTPGSQRETVQVSAETPLLQVESADVSKDIDTTTTTELPMPDRSAQAMAGLVAGVNIPALYSSGSGIMENGALTFMFNANGQVLGANNTNGVGWHQVTWDMALGLDIPWSRSH